ncbi:putative ubiquitin-conjugating enzyme E2 38 [Impatiens glandulifera]|uniref:putative ubiquitin-conjugating enzyme E2 38 n=1 Tax=Impatiens glandulifera TaxID=253017 RepID=UPI001FB1083F|nr:putative ubiquitin-conjugating enzyme E2 38 [Impatiens glandulifera]
MDRINHLKLQAYLDSISNKEIQNQAHIIEELGKSGSHENNDASYQGLSDYDDSDGYESDDCLRALQTQVDKVLATVAFPNYTIPSGEDMTEFKHYGRFDFVDRFPNHFFETLNLHKPSSMWIKRVQEELKFLDNMPDSINVKACEARTDLIQAVIVGSAGTPYHDGLFVFDLAFPPSYPDVLPTVYYHSGGLQLNPNMSKDGIVRLNTWKLEKGEPIPKMSTMAQVLCSIQVLIFNSKPFFNEPGNSEIYVGKKGKKKSKDYNESVFILSLKTMMNTLTSPPEHFEELIKWHFRVRAHHILSACKSYIDGTQIGAFGGGFVDDDQSGPSNEFKIALCGMMDDLVNKFIDNGATDCEKFRYVKWHPSIKSNI